MDKAVLLTKLSNYDDKSFELYEHYLNATSKSFVDEKEEFDTCIASIKLLTEKQYDFGWLSENAAEFDCNRRDFKALCDDVCILLGNRINELCRHNNGRPIITKPTKFEDYCPFSNETLVAYGNCNSTIRIDGKVCKLVDTKLENTPYYSVYVHSLDL